MTREELISELKENHGTAYDNVNENNIRQVIRFYDTGQFGGYIGIPKDHPAYSARRNEFCDLFDYAVHGGITYCEKHLSGITKDEDRVWIGFDHGHSFDVRDEKLVREVYGDKKADQLVMIFGEQMSSIRDNTFGDTKRDIDIMTQMINDCVRYCGKLEMLSKMNDYMLEQFLKGQEDPALRAKVECEIDKRKNCNELVQETDEIER